MFHLAHLRIVKPVDDEIIDGVMAVAIALGDGHQFGVAGVSLGPVVAEGLSLVGHDEGDADAMA